MQFFSFFAYHIVTRQEEVLFMSEVEITAAVTALANAVCSGLTLGEIAVAAGLFVQLGDTMATIAAVRGLNEERTEEKAGE